MTRRELSIIGSILAYLHSLDYGQATALQVHAAAFGEKFDGPLPSVAELESALRQCDAEKWINGVPSRFQGKMKWSITDAGEAARLEISR